MQKAVLELYLEDTEGGLSKAEPIQVFAPGMQEGECKSKEVGDGATDKERTEGQFCWTVACWDVGQIGQD